MEAPAKRVYACSYCHDIMSSRQTLLRHKRRKHPNELKSENNEAKKPLICRDCDFRCLMIKKLIQHYQYHGRRLTIREQSFAELEEFLAWKKDIEKKTRALFVLHRGRRETQTTFVKNYYCNRSGFFVPGGKGKRIRLKLSSKINYTCSAYMRVECNKHSGAVIVQFCLDHTHECDNGPDNENGHLQLSKKLHLDIQGELEKPFKIEVTVPSESDIKTSEEINYVTDDEVCNSSVVSNGGTSDNNGTVAFKPYDNSSATYSNDDSATFHRPNDDGSAMYSNDSSAAYSNAHYPAVVMDTPDMNNKGINHSLAIVSEVPVLNNASFEFTKRETLKMMGDLLNIVCHTSSFDTLMSIRNYIVAAHTIGENLTSCDTDHNYERVQKYSSDDSENWECCIKIKKENKQ